MNDDDPLITELIGVCGAASDAIDHATESLLQARTALAEQVLEQRSAAEAAATRCMRLASGTVEAAGSTPQRRRTALHGALMVAPLRRMIAIAADIAAMTIRNDPDGTVPEEVDGHVAEMGRLAVAMAETARDVLDGAEGDADGREAVMKELHGHLLTALLAPGWRHPASATVDTALLGRLYDRYAAHAAQTIDRAARIAGRLPAGPSGRRVDRDGRPGQPGLP